MEFRHLDVQAYGCPHAFSSPAVHVIQDRAELSNTYGESLASIVDLDKWFVVGVHRGLCRSGGYSVKIEDIKRSPHTVTVTVHYRDPEPGELVTLVMTEPSDVVLVSKAGLQPGEEIDFSFRDQGGVEIWRRTVTVSQAGG